MVMSRAYGSNCGSPGRGNWVASGGAAQRTVPVKRGGNIPESASTRVNRRTTVARPHVQAMSDTATVEATVQFVDENVEPTISDELVRSLALPP